MESLFIVCFDSHYLGMYGFSKRPFMHNHEHVRFERLRQMKNEKLLQVFSSFRKAFIDASLNMIISNVNDCKQNATNKQYKCQYRASGSEASRSDYDITLTGMGREDVCIIFNRNFQEYFHATSSEVFDCNVYGSSYFDITEHTLPSWIVVDQNISIPARYDVNIQHKFAFVKLFLYRELLSDIAEGPSPPSLKAPIQSARLFVDKYKSVKRLPMKTQNIRYAHILKKVSQYRKTNDSRYTDAIALSSFYAHEAYYTRGAIYDVVLKRQFECENISNYMNEHDYMDSFLENAGDLYKQLQQSRTKDCDSLIMDISKYLARLLDAYRELSPNHDSELLSNVHHLKVNRHVLKPDAELLEKSKSILKHWLYPKHDLCKLNFVDIVEKKLDVIVLNVISQFQSKDNKLLLTLDNLDKVVGEYQE